MILLHLKNKTSVSSWALPVDNGYSFRGIKVDGDILYLTLFDVQQIFLCNSKDGKVLNKFGNTRASSKEGEFNDPHGVTVNMKYLYVCDHNNNRIQVLTKDKGIFCSQWGNKIKDQLDFPFSIFYDELEMLFYIGDQCRISLYARDIHTGNGYCIQRFGDLKSQMDQLEGLFFGICRINERLYISDCQNNRILIFKRKQFI